MKYKKALAVLLTLICLCVVSFASFNAGVRYGSQQMLDEDWKYYLSQFYFQLYNTTYLLSSIDRWGKSIHITDVTANPYRQLLTNLNAMKILNDHAAWDMRGDKNSHYLKSLSESLKLIEASIGGGIYIDDQLICNDFLEDDILSENEISFLTFLKQDLENIKDSLYNPETRQVDLNITMKELSEAVKPFIVKYSISNLHNVIKKLMFFQSAI